MAFVVVGLRNISAYGLGRSACVHDLAAGRRRGDFIDIRDEDIRAFGSEPLADRLADPPTVAGHCC